MSDSWKNILEAEFDKEYFQIIKEFVKSEQEKFEIYPPKADIFKAFDLCPIDKTKVVILGQDPYFNGVAHGLSFSVKPNSNIPPSLRNIYKELRNDLNIEAPTHGSLVSWAKQGVLLLNSALTVRQGEPGSHIAVWEPFTKQIIKTLNNVEQPIVFIIWGNFAKKKQYLITNENHLILSSSHPSPLGAYAGFLGCKHFSKTNDFLIKNKIEPIDWRIK